MLLFRLYSPNFDANVNIIRVSKDLLKKERGKLTDSATNRSEWLFPKWFGRGGSKASGPVVPADSSAAKRYSRPED